MQPVESVESVGWSAGRQLQIPAREYTFAQTGRQAGRQAGRGARMQEGMLAG